MVVLSTWPKQLNPNKINRRSAVQWYFTLIECSPAQWIRLCLQSFIFRGPRFESQAHNLRFMISLNLFERYFWRYHWIVKSEQGWHKIENTTFLQRLLEFEKKPPELSGSIYTSHPAAPRVWFPSTTSKLFQFIFELWWEKDKNKQKEAGIVEYQTLSSKKK